MYYQVKNKIIFECEVTSEVRISRLERSFFFKKKSTQVLYRLVHPYTPSAWEPLSESLELRARCVPGGY
jgi:hypothetical protein